MTAVIAVKTEEGILMGSDTQITCGHQVSHVEDSKVFFKGDMVMGFAGDLKYGNVLKYRWFPPERSKDIEDDEQYICAVVIPSLEEVLTSMGDWKPKGLLLLGYRGEVYDIYYDLSVVKSLDNVICIGNGYEVLKGYFTGRTHNVDQYENSDKLEEIILDSIEYTALHVDGVSGIGAVEFLENNYGQDS